MSQRRRNGLSVMEMIVALAIVALLAAAMLPGLRTRQHAGDSAALVSALRGLRQAIGNYRDHVGWYPSSLVQLQSLPGAGDAAQTNSCGATVAQTIFNSRWRGSYFGGLAGVGGLQIGAMGVSPVLSRVELTGGRAYLRIEVSDVPETTAEYVDVAFDPGSFSPTTGAITWTEAGSSGYGTLYYNMPVEAC